MKKRIENKVQNVPKVTPYRNGWRARTTALLVDDSNKRIEGYGDTKEDALQKCQQKVQERNTEILSRLESENAERLFCERKNAGNISLCEAIEARLANRVSEISESKGRPVRDTTISSERSVYKTLIQLHPIGGKKIKDLTSYDLVDWRKYAQNYISATRKKPLSSSYKNRAYVLLENVLMDYYRFRSEKNPISDIDSWVQKRQKKSKQDFLIGDELKVFIYFCEQRKGEKRYPLDEKLADMYILQLILYRRPGEIRGLKAKDWVRSTNTLTILRTGIYADGRTKSEAAKEPLAVYGKCADILNARCAGLSPEDYIFSNVGSSTGIMRKDSYNKTFQKWLKEAGINKKLHVHSLRGSGISYAQYAGANPNAVSANAGHSDTRTTQDYYTVCYDDSRNAASKIMAEAFL